MLTGQAAASGQARIAGQNAADSLPVVGQRQIVG